MKKVALMVLVAVFAASPAVAAKKKSKRMHTAAAQTDLNANSKKLIVDAFPSMLPSWAIPIYLHTHKSDGGKKKK
jgi:hypothetical protein